MLPEGESTLLKVPDIRFYQNREKSANQEASRMEDQDNEAETQEEEKLNEISARNVVITVSDEEMDQQAAKRWGKMACLAAFLVQLIVLGQYHCSGIIYSALLHEYKDGRANTALILSMAASATHAFGPLTAYVTERFGPWPVGLTGGALCSLGLLFCSFCPVVPLLYLTYGLAWGLGSCMCHRASLAIMCQYFEKYLMVNSLAWIGCALVTFALSPSLQDLFHKYTAGSAFRILAGVELSLVLCAALYIPFARQRTPETHTQSPLGNNDRSSELQDKVFSLEVFRNRKFLLWLLAVIFLMFINLVPLVHIIQLAKDMKIDSVNTAMLVSYLAIGSSTGRLFFGRLLASVHGHNRVRVVQSGLLFIGAFTFVLPFAPQDFCLALYVLVFGFFEGCFATLIPIITVDIVGTDLVPSGLSWLYTIGAFPEAIGPLIAGWVHDKTGSYAYACYFFGATSLLAIVLMALLQLIVKEPEVRCMDCGDYSGEVAMPLEPLTKQNHLQIPTVELHQ